MPRCRFRFGWSDVGYWPALREIAGCDGNLIAAAGVCDLIAVMTGDVMLVVPKGRDQDVKKLLAHGVLRHGPRQGRLQDALPNK